MKKAFVLLSGGLDSTTCLFQAIFDYMPDNPDINLAYGDKHVWVEVLKNVKEGEVEIGWVEAVSIYYGQRHKKETDYAAKTCKRLGIKHTTLDVGSLLRGDTVMLTDDSRGHVEVPDVDYAVIKGVSPTYVPFRNGLMLSALTAHAQKWVNEENTALDQAVNEGGADLSPEDKPMAGIYFGAHSEDAHNWAYPDCTPEFIGAFANAIYIGSYMQIRLHTPLQWLNKEGVVRLGYYLGVRFKDTWSCYKGEEYHCGTCPTCRSRRHAFEAARISDPTIYANDVDRNEV
jgi:7-cyano-7-deazaguanine synthase